jgi:hypothetical protein
MKAFVKKYLPLLVLLGGPALTSTFVKVISQASVDEAISDGYSHITYDKLSAVDVVWESIAVALSDYLDKDEIIALGLLIMLLLVAIIQIIAGIIKNYKVMLYSSILLFSSLSAILAFIVYSIQNITICYGYYAYLVLQAIVLVLSPSATKTDVQGV